VGSMVATTLARGGARAITILDPENVEAGNICRSTYSMNDVYLPKVIALYKQLTAISPFLDIDYLSPEGPLILKKSMDESQLLENKKVLTKYDWIFDCTSDNELSFMLDKIEPSATVINISITDEAQQLVCVVGSHVTDTKKIIFEKYHQKEVSFYEGTGCWHPTFKASFFDISSLVHLALKNINKKLLSGQKLNTFEIEVQEENGIFKLVTNDY
jgi:hypothetical protein